MTTSPTLLATTGPFQRHARLLAALAGELATRAGRLGVPVDLIAATAADGEPYLDITGATQRGELAAGQRRADRIVVDLDQPAQPRFAWGPDLAWSAWASVRRRDVQLAAARILATFGRPAPTKEATP